MATNNCANNWHDVRGPQKTFFIRNFGGGSVIVWAAISSRGSSELVFLEGKQNSLKYVETLDQYLFPLCDKFGDDAVIFQHDNAPLHTSRLTKTFLQKRNLKEQQKKDASTIVDSPGNELSEDDANEEDCRQPEGEQKRRNQNSGVTII